MSPVPLPVFTRPPGWRDALCAQTDPDVFVPATAAEWAAAKRICRLCDHNTACLEWALANPVAAGGGVYGGTSQRERRLMLRHRATEVAA